MKLRMVFAAVCLTVICINSATAQSQEMQQLILNVEKLAQFKSILEDMKKGYESLSKGYNTVKDISEGNFSLHKTFLDGLLEVSPVVKSYKRIGETVNCQLVLVNEYKKALRRFRDSNMFSEWELQYMEKVCKGIFNESLAGLNDLLSLVTSGLFRMSDEERLNEIDAVYDGMQGRLVFLRSFNSSTAILVLQRQKEKNDVEALKAYYGR